MKKILLIAFSALSIISCDSNQKAADQSDSSKVDTSKKTVTEKSNGNTDVDSTKIWTYTTEVDKMTSKKKYLTTINATNLLQFDSPYDGGSTAGIMLRNQDNTNNVMLIIDKGQFVCASDGCSIKVRFDNDAAITFPASEPSDGSSNFLFIDQASKFIKHAKASKHIIVQAEFYESGLKEMEFNSAGLKWDY